MQEIKNRKKDTPSIINTNIFPRKSLWDKTQLEGEATLLSFSMENVKVQSKRYSLWSYLRPMEFMSTT